MKNGIDQWIFLGLALALLLVPHLLWRGRAYGGLALFLLGLALVQANCWTHGQWQVLEGVAQMAMAGLAPLLWLSLRHLSGQPWSWRWGWHGLPALLILALWTGRDWWQQPQPLAVRQGIYAGVLLLGVGYLRQILHILSALRHPHALSQVEWGLVVLAMGLGLGAAVGLLLGVFLDQWLFFALYGSLISLLVVLGHALLLGFPQSLQVLADELSEAQPCLTTASATHDPAPAVTPVTDGAAADPTAEKNIRLRLPAARVAPLLAQLNHLFEEEKIHRRHDLSLRLLADRLQLSLQQASELLNEHQGLGFNRLVKNHRIAEARQLLLTQPDQPAIDIGLAVGFSSLSAFYAAFRELEGMAPGQYRKQQQSSRRR